MKIKVLVCAINRKLIVSILGFAACFSTPVFATEGVMYLTGGAFTRLTDDHHGTIVTASILSTLDCQGHRIVNSSQPAVCSTDNGSTFQCGVEVANASRVVVQNCVIENFDVGINVRNASIISIDNNELLDNTEGLRAVQFNTLWAYGNKILRGLQGISIRNASSFFFSFNDVWWVGGDGVDINFSDKVYLDNNVFYDNTDHNVEIDDSSSIVVRNNYFDGRRVRDGVDLETTSDNLQIENASNITVRDNFIRDAGRNGIYIRNVNNGVVRNNDVDNSGRIDSDAADCRHRDSTNITYSGNNFRTVYSSGTCGR